MKRSIRISIAEEYAAILKNINNINQSGSSTWKFKFLKREAPKENPSQLAAKRLLSLKETNEHVRLALSLPNYEKLERHFYSKKTFQLYPNSDIFKAQSRLVNLLNEDNWQTVLFEYENNYK